MQLDLTKFYQAFFEESREAIETMEAGLLMLVGNPDPEVLNSVFRAAHTIKGSSGSLGLPDISQFTHQIETLLDEMRAGERSPSAQNTNALLEAVDCLHEMLQAKRAGTDTHPARIQQVTAKLETLIAMKEPKPAPPKPAAIQRNFEESVWRIVFTPHPQIFKSGNDPARLLKELDRLGALSVTADCAHVPGLDAMDAEDCYLRWILELKGSVQEREIREVFDWVESECDLLIEKLAPASMEAQPANEAMGASSPALGNAAPTVKASDTGSIRVSTGKVDAIINLVGELVITQSMLNRFGDQFDMSMIEKLRGGLAQLARNTRELQETVLKIRMLPISFTFNRFPRLVHDLSVKLNKKSVLNVSGEQTELDKTVLEKVSDPLMHLVRNALDHGIERPAVRLAAGKPETGTVYLHASHQGGGILIEVRDDGAGLDKNRILAKARARGLVSAEEQLSDEKIYDLIFAAGFSTADEVTDISGRGVGMDVVRRNIHELGGNIEIRTQAGQGTSFLIKLPLTLAILDGQLVRVSDQTYVIPLVSIVESLQVKRHEVKRVAGGAEVYRLRSEYIPIVRLYEVFNLQPAVTQLENGLLVVVEADGQRAGLFVDDLLAQQQVVIKSLESNYQRIDGVSGATILGDGKVAVILDVPGVLRLERTRALAQSNSTVAA